MFGQRPEAYNISAAVNRLFESLFFIARRIQSAALFEPEHELVVESARMKTEVED